MISCAILEDEPLAMGLLQDYVKRIPDFELLFTSTKADIGLEQIHRLRPVVLFLDIQMPELTGIDIVKVLPYNPIVVITTAYAEYAVESYNYNIADYLLKPITLDRFVQTIGRIRIMLQKDMTLANSFRFFKSGYQLVKIDFDDILYIESADDYSKVYTTDKVVVSNEKMKDLSLDLPELIFMRVHRSFLINLSKIEAIERNRIIVGETYIPIGGKYRESFLKKIG